MNFVSALEVKYPTILGKSLNSNSSLGDFVCYLFSTGLALAISITAIVIVVGGIYYLISYGRGGYADEGKEWIKGGVLGLLIIVCSSLILYTINPDISSCKIAFLPQLNLSFLNGNRSTLPEETIVATYNEIPIGLLTENLLTRTAVCLNYNKYGDVMTPSTTQQTGSNGQPEPNNKSDTAQDRVACLRQMIEGAQKKANVIAELSSSITRLMDTCSCMVKDANGNYTGQSKCDPVCDPANGGCTPRGPCPSPNGSCFGSCIGGLCKQPVNTTDCCPAGVKDKIEHGPVFVHLDASKDPSSYGNLGSNNVPCEKTCSQDSDCLIATFTNSKGKKETVNIEHCDPDTRTCGKKYNGLDEFRCNPNETTTSALGQSTTKCSEIIKLVSAGGGKQGKLGITGIAPDKWFALSLWQQLKFFQESVEKSQDIFGFQADIDNLQSARKTLSKCYLAIPSVDLINTYNVSDQQQRVEIKKPAQLYDYTTGNMIDPSKYCTGFNYANSICLKTCNNMCPDTSQGAMSAYRKCTGKTGAEADACIQNAYNSRPCPYGDSSSSTFSQCISTCQNSCKSVCGLQYASCSPEYNFCESQCASNGQCVLDNADQCLFGGENFINCSNANSDQGNVDYCINTAYSCKNGSNQYAYYPDCINSQSSPLNCPAFTNQENCENAGEIGNGCTWNPAKCVRSSVVSNQTTPPCSTFDNQNNCQNSNRCVWQPATCSQEYSSSYLFKNPEVQKCTNASVPAENGICQSSSNSSANCKTVCPETAKCPTASDCPSCPCDKIDQPFEFYVPNRSTAVSEKTCSSNSDCPVDQSCIEKVCMSNGKKKIACTNNTNCPAGETCSPKSRTCITNAGKEGSEWKKPNISVYQMVGPQCNGYNYNDDPLTFYCQDNWWNDPQKEKNDPPLPVGAEKTCKKENDIPVGQTVDNAISWANKLISSIGALNKDTQIMLDQMIKIGKAKDTDPVRNYCTCSARLGNNEPICTTNCKYSQQQIKVNVQVIDNNGFPVLDTFGNPVYVEQLQWQCNCDLEPCKGDPCQQVIDYNSQLWNNYKQLKTNYISFDTWIVEEPRSDILKSLTYSRQRANSCSLSSNIYGGSEVRMLSCSRAEDELLSPINQEKIRFDNKDWTGYCYGENLGKVADKDLTDDWFCCEKWDDKSTINNNPIYNIKNNNF